MNTGLRIFRLLPILVFAVLSSGCAVVVNNATDSVADALSNGVMNHDDPETVRAAMPAYMIMIDGLIADNPDSSTLLSAAATLYASYGAIFADTDLRASRLSTRARSYALRAMCAEYEPSCGWREMIYDDFVATLDGLDEKHAEFVYTYGLSTLVYLRAHSDDWNALAELPQVEALFNRYLEIAGDSAAPATHTYMGILLTLRPPALGGKPEEARAHFERAIELTEGRDLSAKVEFARGYAMLLYERELHDRLLIEVIQADAYADGLTLSNVLAKEDAAAMLAAADDYF